MEWRRVYLSSEAKCTGKTKQKAAKPQEKWRNDLNLYVYMSYFFFFFDSIIQRETRISLQTGYCCLFFLYIYTKELMASLFFFNCFKKISQ